MLQPSAPLLAIVSDDKPPRKGNEGCHNKETLDADRGSVLVVVLGWLGLIPNASPHRSHRLQLMQVSQCFVFWASCDKK